MIEFLVMHDVPRTGIYLGQAVVAVVAVPTISIIIVEMKFVPGVSRTAEMGWALADLITPGSGGRSLAEESSQAMTDLAFEGRVEGALARSRG